MTKLATINPSNYQTINNDDESGRIREAYIWKSERTARQLASSGLRGHGFTSPFVDAYAALLVFIFHLISVASLVSISSSVYLTIHCYNRFDGNTVDGSIMNWVLLSFAVIIPLSSSIGMAFARRDAGLNHMASIKATLVHIYSAHACWDWRKVGKVGRDPEYDWLAHCDSLLEASVQLSHEICRLLTLPTASRARHRVTSWGCQEAALTEEVMTELHLSISDYVWRMTELCEDFKSQGLPPNEAGRIRQWERMVSEKIEMLIVLKRYRTPQALRSFARLFTVILPPFYAPYYAQMARDLDSISLAIAFAVITAIALTTLFESIQQMEDPFVDNLKLDNIDVIREFEIDLKKQLLATRGRHFRDASPFRGKDAVEIYET